MKQIILIALLAGFVFAACNKAKELTYASHDNVYLDLYGSERDSILYTFAYEPDRGKDTIYISVRISGIRQHEARKFILKAEPDSSTAQVNVHYKPLEDYYTIPADSGYYNVPLIIYNTDTLLQQRSVTLKFRLFPTDDFGTNIPDLIYGKVVFSSKLERPDWWNMWFGSYYSQVKHQFFIITTGLTVLSTDGLDAPKNLYLVSLVTTFLSDPFKWISKNPTKGYVMTQRADGDYDFYNVNNPAKTVLYRKNALSGKYYFIDENGLEVN